MANRKSRPHLSILTISDLQQEASKKLPVLHTQYFNEGAGDLITLRDNEASFNRYKLRPRVLRNVDDCDLSTTIFGTQVAAPFGFAPTAAHKAAHPDGEQATSRAAAVNNLPLCLSSWGTFSLEDVIAEGGSNPYAMQITFLRDRSVTQRIIQRAEKAGYRALFVSVDLPVLGNRLNESRNNFTFPSNVTFPNLAFPSSSSSSSSSSNTSTTSKAPIGILTDQGPTITSTPTSTTDSNISTSSLDYDPTIHWSQTIPWLRTQTKLEIWLKGVYTPEDVELAIQHGVDGVVISNHGGRQLDGVPATLDALRDCARVLYHPSSSEGKGTMKKTKKIQIAIDGGIRRGSDIFKALALGADFVFVGRPVIWGLAYDGEKGVDLACKILMNELRQTMMLCGCQNVGEIGSGHLSVLNSDGVLAKL